MNIVLHSSDLFSPVLSVSIVSILENNKEEKEINFYIIEHNISIDHQAMVERMVKHYPNAFIVFIPMPDVNQEFGLGLKMIKSIWLFDSYCRLFLGTLLPKDVERVLYLDCDTLCCGSLRKFYNMDMEDCYAAGVIDCLSEEYYKLFGMDSTSRYCNSGIILFDLKKWREDNIEEKIAEYVRSQDGYVFFMEQSVFNIVLQNKIKVVHPRYNTYTLMAVFSHRNLRLLRRCVRFYSDEEIDEALATPVLMHLTNCFYVKGRPWIEGNNHPYRELFMKYRALTPWKDVPLFPDKSSILQKTVAFIAPLMPQGLLCRIIGWVYNDLRPNKIRRASKAWKATHGCRIEYKEGKQSKKGY